MNNKPVLRAFRRWEVAFDEYCKAKGNELEKPLFNKMNALYETYLAESQVRFVQQALLTNHR
jgi:hypothetical protein